MIFRQICSISFFFFVLPLSLHRRFINLGGWKQKRRGRKLPSLIPRTGSRIALSQDKQLSQPTPLRIMKRGIREGSKYGSHLSGIHYNNTPYVNASLGHLLRGTNLRDLYVEESFRKRPFVLRIRQSDVAKTP